MNLAYFQLIDRIVALDLAKRTIRTEAAVPRESTIFEGHFPGHPLMPGVLLIEAMAQTAGWLVIGATRFSRMPFLAAIKEAKLRTFVTPGITADGKPICDANLTFRLMDFPSPEFRTFVDEWAARLAFPSEALAHG
jgi:3-hydroxyacyl-[acyl-carrier-protein] dehydratase